jgi:hypothetical protein
MSILLGMIPATHAFRSPSADGAPFIAGKRHAFEMALRNGIDVDLKPFANTSLPSPQLCLLNAKESGSHS